jgi:hypothetical protein
MSYPHIHTAVLILLLYTYMYLVIITKAVDVKSFLTK